MEENRNVVKYFMWSWQQYFQIQLECTAEEIFKALDPSLEPTAFMVGFLKKERADRHPICVAPEDDSYSPEEFNEVEKFAEYFSELSDENHIHYSHPYIIDKKGIELTDTSLKGAVEKILNRNGQFLNKISFCSMPTIIEDYAVCCVLQLNRKVFKTHYTLINDKIDDRYPIPTSLLDAAIFNFLKNCTEALSFPNPGEGFQPRIVRNTNEALRAAGERLMYTPMIRVNGHPHQNLFDCCNSIASLRYEGKEVKGEIIFAKSDNSNIETVVTLQQPVGLHKARAVRKLLEMSGNGLSLLSNTDTVYGLGQQIGTYNSHLENIFTINFTKHHKWELRHANQEMMTVVHGVPQLPAKPIDEKKFKSDMFRLFSDVTDEDVQRLWKITIAAIQQEHGTILVISDKAKEESERLAEQSTVIKPFLLSPYETLMLTSIDGAVLIDPFGKCYAIGVILDGMATAGGSPIRGARYNSAVRYVNTMRKNHDHKCLAIVVSEDGMIDLIPNLMPKIKRRLIEEKVEELRKINESDNKSPKKFNQIMSWLKENQFYLMPELTNEINQLRKDIETELEKTGAVRINYRDFSFNPEMNESFFE